MDKKKKILIAIGILLILTVCVGITYAYYLATVTQQGENVVKTDCFQLTYEDEGQIILDNAYPVRDSDVNTVVPYHFKIKNICNSPATYQINLEVLNDSTLDVSYLKYKINNKEIKALADVPTASQPTLQNATISKELLTGNVFAGQEKEFDLRLWLKESATTSDPVQNKFFKSKVVVISTLNSNLINKRYEILSGDLDTIGSEVKIEDEEFYVIGQEDESHVKLLSKWNLNINGIEGESSTGLQDSRVRGYVRGDDVTSYGGTIFSYEEYWHDSTNNKLNAEYGGYSLHSSESSAYDYSYYDESENKVYPYVYDSNSTLYQYVDEYVTHLNNYGVNVTGRLINYQEIVDLGCNPSTVYCDANEEGGSAPEWVYQTTYWSGSASANRRVWVVASVGYFDRVSNDEDDFYGVRPVIILEK